MSEKTQRSALSCFDINNVPPGVLPVYDFNEPSSIVFGLDQKHIAECVTEGTIVIPMFKMETRTLEMLAERILLRVARDIPMQKADLEYITNLHTHVFHTPNHTCLGIGYRTQEEVIHVHPGVVQVHDGTRSGIFGVIGSVSVYDLKPEVHKSSGPSVWERLMKCRRCQFQAQTDANRSTMCYIP